MYKITIEKTTVEKDMVQNSWTIIEKRPYTIGEAEKSFAPKSLEGAMKDIYGYPPAIEKDVQVKQTILVQEIDELDVGKVIQAINKL